MRLQACVAAAFAAVTFAAQAAPGSGLGTWETTLQGRDLDGDLTNGYEAFYDTVLDMTWLANPTYAAVAPNSPSDRPFWDVAEDWVESLTIYGVSGWRLPRLLPINGVSYSYEPKYDGSSDTGYNITSPRSELSHLYHVTLGIGSYYLPNGERDYLLTQHHGPFERWTGLDFWVSGNDGINGIPGPLTSPWVFSSSIGYQDRKFYLYEVYAVAWPVRSGDIAATIPEPGPIGMVVAGLAVTGLVWRRKAING